MKLNGDFIPPPDPWVLFREWYTLAEQSEPNDPNAMALATATQDGLPSVRMVLLKSYDDGTLTFFTNRQSRKGQDLQQNPRAALCLHWKSLNRQIRVEGKVAFMSDAESDAYFASRVRTSQIGAAVSQQSRPLKDRATFEKQLHIFEEGSEGKSIMRPAYWGGYRLIPSRIEFWQERPFRLHDRFVYERDDRNATWKIQRLYP